MLTVTVNSENSKTISIPAEEMEKFGFSDGDEVEISKNERDEIVLRHAQKSERTKKILNATQEIIERRKLALIELGKGHE